MQVLCPGLLHLLGLPSLLFLAMSQQVEIGEQESDIHLYHYLNIAKTLYQCHDPRLYGGNT